MSARIVFALKLLPLAALSANAAVEPVAEVAGRGAVRASAH